MKPHEPFCPARHVSAGRQYPRDYGNALEMFENRWRVLNAPGARQALSDAETLAEMQRFERNIENFIGTVKLPVGLAGPLRVNGRYAHGDFYVPLATTEAALVASYSRGGQLITAAGGCIATVLAEAVSRAPGFAFANLNEAGRFVLWLGTQRERLEQSAHATTRHGRLIDVRPTVEGNHVYVNFEFETGDAAGQNMVTFATEAICQFILASSPVKPRYFFLEANHSGDKKASARSFLGVRGKRVSAEVSIGRELVEQRLHTSIERMTDYWRMAAIGGVLSGTMGVHGHYANGIAALYIACGQDAACVAESAVGITRLEAQPDGGLYASVTLPNVIAGTVGGGTGLPSQRACLEILRVLDAGGSRAFAELCAALVLAGELSIIGAMCSGDFARGHAERARGQDNVSGRELNHA